MRSSFVPAFVLCALLPGAPPVLAQDVDLRLSTAVAAPDDRVIATASDLHSGCFFIEYGEPRLEGSRILIEGRWEVLNITCSLGSGFAKRHSFVLPLLSVGDYTVEAVVEGETFDSVPLQIRDRTELFLRDLRFKAEVTWDDPRVGSGRGRAVPLTDESGGFWFFDEKNLEATVKLLDGRGVNGHFWVFLASMTDVGFTLEVTWLDDPCLDDIVDPPVGACNVRTYVQAPGENRNVQDVGAFRFEEE